MYPAQTLANTLSWISGCTLMSCMFKGLGKAHGQQAEDEGHLSFYGFVLSLLACSPEEVWPQ